MILRILLSFIFIHLVIGSKYKRVCYVKDWARNNTEEEKFTPEDIDPFLCTHLLFAFADLDVKSLNIKPDDPTDDPVIYKRFNDLKLKNPELKTMLSIGGWSMASVPFHTVVMTKVSRQTLAKNMVTFLRTRNFDGVDIDWEYPALRGGSSDDKQKLTMFLKVLKDAAEQEAKASGKPRMIISAAVNPSEWAIKSSYEVPKIASYLDFISLMLYDLHGDWEEILTAAHHSQLFPTQTDKDATLNVDYLSSVWAKKGVPKSKIILGVPFYGKSFRLLDKTKSTLGSKVAGGVGDISYRQICLLVQKGASVHRLTDAKVPYIVHSGDKWTGYDDQKSLTEKMKYIISHGYGGAMVWSLDQDDFKGACGKRYPLITAMKNALEGQVVG